MDFVFKPKTSLLEQDRLYLELFNNNEQLNKKIIKCNNLLSDIRSKLKKKTIYYNISNLLQKIIKEKKNRITIASNNKIENIINIYLYLYSNSQDNFNNNFSNNSNNNYGEINTNYKQNKVYNLALDKSRSNKVINLVKIIYFGIYLLKNFSLYCKTKYVNRLSKSISQLLSFNNNFIIYKKDYTL